MSEHKELYSLLIPLHEERLLVPRMCVAEVTAFAEPDTPTGQDVPAWYLGTVDWNGRRLPVVSLDAGGNPPDDRRRAGRRRIVVFHALGRELAGGYFGVVSQGFPQLVRVNRDVLGYDLDTDVPAALPFLCRVRMVHEFPLVPDIDRLEQMLAAQLAAGA